VFQNRASGGITLHKAVYAKDYKQMTSLEAVCRELKPTVAIGAAAIPGAFTEQFIKDMGEFNERPIIFALSNPTSMSECTAEQAYKLTEVEQFRLLLFSLGDQWLWRCTWHDGKLLG
jgi:malate dehydrogenase (oxaloacetate-decarboxylating)(NADP+)